MSESFLRKWERVIKATPKMDLRSDETKYLDAEIRRAVSREREAIANQARYIASLYPQSSDGQNTFVLLAEWIEARGDQQAGRDKS